MAQGTRTIALIKPFILNCLFNSRAIERPANNSRVTDDTVKYTVFFSAFQNLSSLNRKR